MFSLGISRAAHRNKAGLFHASSPLIRRNKRKTEQRMTRGGSASRQQKERNKPPAAAADLSWHPSANGTPRRQERGEENNTLSEWLTNPNKTKRATRRRRRRRRGAESRTRVWSFLGERRKKEESKKKKENGASCANLPSTRSWLRCRSRAAIWWSLPRFSLPLRCQQASSDASALSGDKTPNWGNICTGMLGNM